MKKKGNYLYYVHGSEGTYWELQRTNVKTGKTKTLGKMCTDYAIRNGKIYGEFWKVTDDDEKPYYRVMKMNGKNKKKTSKKPAMKTKKTNAKGYSVKYKERGSYVKTYLKTPKKTYYLGKSKKM